MKHAEALAILNWYARTRNTIWKYSRNRHVFVATMSADPMDPNFEWFGSNIFEAAGHIIAACYATGDPDDASEIPEILNGDFEENGRMAGQRIP